MLVPSSSFDDIMVSYFPYFKGGPKCDISIRRVFKGIRSDVFKETVLNVRKYKSTDIELSKKYKSSLPAVTFCGTFKEKRNLESCVHYNNVMVIDIDHIDDNMMDLYAQYLAADPFVATFWHSPSGNGYKGLVHLQYDEEVEKLFVLMRRLREEGVGIIFVTHFLEQVYAVCDRITVLRNGELVGEYETKDLPRVMLVAKMMGKDFDDLADIKGDRKDKKVFSETPVIEAEGIGHKGTIRPFDLKINKGEVIGLTGLLGSGRSELVRSIYGADKADSGTLKVNGKEVKINSPLDAMKLGMAYLPEDRKAEGIIADLSVRENIIIAMQAKKGMFHPMSRKEMEEAADKYIDMLQIKTASRETPIKSLSGGNQQKVILGRWLLTNPEYLILDEPTRGIDIGTKTEIQKIVLDLADQGMAVTFISSEVEEMLRTCSRMAVLRDGEKVGELEESELSQSNIMKAIAGGDDKNE